MRKKSITGWNKDTDHLDYKIAKLKVSGDKLKLEGNYLQFGEKLPQRSFNKGPTIQIDGKQVNVYEAFIQKQGSHSIYNKHFAILIVNNFKPKQFKLNSSEEIHLFLQTLRIGSFEMYLPVTEKLACEPGRSNTWDTYT